MMSAFSRRLVIVVTVGLLSELETGCIVPAGGYGYPNGVGIGSNYYQPVNGYYGGWYPGDGVSPYWNGDYRSHGGRGPPSFGPRGAGYGRRGDHGFGPGGHNKGGRGSSGGGHGLGGGHR